MTQIELANRLNVNQSTISMIETGERNPSFELLYRLASELGVTVSELIGEEVKTA